MKAKHSTVVSILKAVGNKDKYEKVSRIYFFEQKQANTLVGHMIKPLLTTFAWSRWLSGCWSFSFSSGFLFLILCLAIDVSAQSNAKKKREVGPYPFVFVKHTCWFNNSCIVCHTPSSAFLYHISNTNQWIVSQTNSLSVPGWVKPLCIFRVFYY